MEKEYERRVRFVKERFEPLKASYEPQFETEMNEADVTRSAERTVLFEGQERKAGVLTTIKE